MRMENAGAKSELNKLLDWIRDDGQTWRTLLDYFYQDEPIVPDFRETLESLEEAGLDSLLLFLFSVRWTTNEMSEIKTKIIVDCLRELGREKVTKIWKNVLEEQVKIRKQRRQEELAAQS